MCSELIDLSTRCLELHFQAKEHRLALSRLSCDGYSWHHPHKPSGLFGMAVDGMYQDASSLAWQRTYELSAQDGARHIVLVFGDSGIEVEQHLLLYSENALLEFWPLIRNQGQAAICVERIDSLSLNLPERPLELFSFSSDWGREFEPQHRPLEGEIILESRCGRSSKGNHPWFALSQPDGGVLSGAVAWSGNWVLRFEPLPGGGHRLSGGLHDWAFSKELAPGAVLEGPPLILVLGPDLEAVAQEYASIGRRYWYPRNALSTTAPVEWNHWWPYEDVEINEATFLENVEQAAQIGCEVCTLDAGWFGPNDPHAAWYDHRGDWDQVNTRRFPGGMRKLADRVHALGMKFGMWCEIEALGAQARLAQEHADYAALRDGERLGYVCFGNPEAQEWAYHTLERLIVAYQADWIKLDFNLDPGGGCNRSDHGHQAGDGLYEHVRGYYRTLDRLRQNYPEVMLENCSSGGLRIDLGMLRHTHMTFLSDPDYPVHSLQVFWGASTHLAPNVLLHFTFSEWRSPDQPPEQNFDAHDPNLTRKKWDYYARIAMLGLNGLSQKLPQLPAWLKQRVIEQNQLYKDHIRRFILNANLFHLTDQPHRDGSGERWAAFQYSMPDGKEHLLFVFRLPGAEPQRLIRLKGLQPERLYHIGRLEGEEYEQRNGRSLMEDGFLFSKLEEEESLCLRLT